MPVGLRFQRKHRFLGYKIKYFYYSLVRRDVLQKHTSYGNMKNTNTIYIVKPDYQDGVEGLLSLMLRQVLYINEAKNKNFIPYVDWKNYNTQYYDGKNNAWDFFFMQPSSLTEEDVYHSQNVMLSGWTFKNINPYGLLDQNVFFDKKIKEQSNKILHNCLQFNNQVNDMVERESIKIDIQNCIGVYVRGTDYTRLKPPGEFVQPNIDQIKSKVSEFLKKYDLPIFLVTEDGDIYDSLLNSFPNKIRIVSYDSFIRNYSGKNVLSKSNVLEENKKIRGQKYLVKMILLSKCKYLISSITQGSIFSYSLKDGNYEDEYIFDLGLY